MLGTKIQADQYPRLFYSAKSSCITVTHGDTMDGTNEQELFSANVTYNDNGEPRVTIYLSADARIIKCKDSVIYTTEARDDKSKETEGNAESSGEESEEDTRI